MPRFHPLLLVAFLPVGISAPRSGEPKQRLGRLVRFEECFRRSIGEN